MKVSLLLFIAKIPLLDVKILISNGIKTDNLSESAECFNDRLWPQITMV